MRKIIIEMSDSAEDHELHKLTENINFAIVNNGFKVNSVTAVVE